MKATTPSFILTLPLRVEIWQKHVLEKRFTVARHLYNDCLNEAKKRIQRMRRDPEYKKWIKAEKSKEKNEQLKNIQKKHLINEYAFHSYIKNPRKIYNYGQKNEKGEQKKSHIDSNSAQKIATRVWQSVEKYLFGNGEKVHFKKNKDFHSIESKSNNSGIRFILNSRSIEWNGLKIPISIRNRDTYAQEALKNRVKYVRIVREYIDEKPRFYAQLVLEGIPPKKERPRTEARIEKISLGQGDVGIDIGTSTVAIAGEKDILLAELAPNTAPIEREQRLIQRKMDRSRRAMNPENYAEDGTIRRKKRMKWKKSKRYIKLQMNLAMIQRKLKIQRKLSHRIMINSLLQFGNSFFVEKMSFSGLSRRAKNTTKSEKTGKINRKKRFGKSIGNRAPAMFISLFEYKVKQLGGTFEKIETAQVKASQYNHKTDEFKKKKLHERWNELDSGVRVQRDLYSAFLIQNVCSDLKTIDKEKVEQRFEQFFELHNKEMQRISALPKKLLSMG